MDYIIFTREHEEQEEEKTTILGVDDLEKMQKIFLDYQDRLGLKNITLELVDAETSYADEDAGIVGISLDHAVQDYAHPYIIGHELGHIDYSADHSAAYQTIHALWIAAKESLTGKKDSIKEDAADKVTVFLSARNIRSAYEYLLGSYYFTSKEDFLNYAHKKTQQNNSDGHSPNTTRITKMMLGRPE